MYLYVYVHERVLVGELLPSQLIFNQTSYMRKEGD